MLDYPNERVIYIRYIRGATEDRDTRVERFGRSLPLSVLMKEPVEPLPVLI